MVEGRREGKHGSQMGDSTHLDLHPPTVTGHMSVFNVAVTIMMWCVTMIFGLEP